MSPGGSTSDPAPCPRKAAEKGSSPWALAPTREIQKKPLVIWGSQLEDGSSITFLCNYAFQIKVNLKNSYLNKSLFFSVADREVLFIKHLQSEQVNMQSRKDPGDEASPGRRDRHSNIHVF